MPADVEKEPMGHVWVAWLLRKGESAGGFRAGGCKILSLLLSCSPCILHLTGSLFPPFSSPRPHLSSHLAHSTILALSPRPPIHSASSSPLGARWLPSSLLRFVFVGSYFGSYFLCIVGVLARQKQWPFDVRCFGSVLGLPVISCG